MRHEEQPDRTYSEDRGLSLKAAREAERAAAVADICLDIDAYLGGPRDHLMAGAHGLVWVAGIWGAAAPYDTRRHAQLGRTIPVLGRLLFGFVEGRHQPPDHDAALERGNRLGRGAALAGALAAADEIALADLEQPVEAELEEHLPVDATGDSSLATPDLGLLFGGRFIEVERRHYARPSAANAAALRAAICRRASAWTCWRPIQDRMKQRWSLSTAKRLAPSVPK